MRLPPVRWSVYSQVAFGLPPGEPKCLGRPPFVFGAVTQCVRHGTHFGIAPPIASCHITPPLLRRLNSPYIPPMIP